MYCLSQSKSLKFAGGTADRSEIFALPRLFLLVKLKVPLNDMQSEARFQLKPEYGMFFSTPASEFWYFFDVQIDFKGKFSLLSADIKS